MQTIDLTELHARIIIHRDTLKKWQHHAALKAITRLIAAGHKTFPSAPALTAAHAELVAAACRSSQSDEASMLAWALDLPTLPPAIATRVVTHSATFADIEAVLQHRPDLASTRISGTVAAFVKLRRDKVGVTADQMPARISSITQQLEELSHADFGIAQASWSSFCSRLRRAVMLVDSSSRSRTPASHLRPEWKSLVEGVKAAAGEKSRRGLHGDLAKIWSLIVYCDRAGIAPSDVSHETLDALRKAEEDSGLGGAFDKIRSIIYAWQRLQKAVPGFPSKELPRIYADGYERTGRIPFERLPTSLQADWAAFVEKHRRKPVSDLAALVVFAGDDLPKLRSVKVVDGSIAPSRWPTMRSTIVSFANAAINIGEKADTLDDVVKPSIVERALREALQRQRKSDPTCPDQNGTLKNLATTAICIAQLIDMSPRMIEQLVDLRDKVHPDLLEIRGRGEDARRIYKDQRMGRRHAQRVGELNDPVKLHAWFSMPDRLKTLMTKALKSGDMPSPTEVNDAVACVLHEITRCCPLRCSNLAALSIFGRDAWLQLPSYDGGKARLLIPAHAVKNRKAIEGELSIEATRTIRLYVDRFRPALMAAVGADRDNLFLFPAKENRHRSGNELNKKFVDRNWNIGGIRINLHVQRHICAKLILDRDPTLMPLVQILLGHNSILTTQRYYADVNTILAQKEFQRIVEQRRRELEKSNLFVQKEKRHAAA